MPHRAILVHDIHVRIPRDLLGDETKDFAAPGQADGEDEVADAPRARLQGAARAAVEAVDKVLPSFTFELEGVKIIEAFDTELAVAGVHVLDGRQSTLLVGTAAAKDSPEQAAVLAVLDATIRCVQSHRE